MNRWSISDIITLAALVVASIACTANLLVNPGVWTRRILMCSLVFTISAAGAIIWQLTPLATRSPSPDAADVMKLKEELKNNDTRLTERQRTIDGLNNKVAALQRELDTMDSDRKKQVAESRQEIQEARSLAEARQRQLDEATQRPLSLEKAPPSQTPMRKVANLPAQDTQWFRATITKCVVRPDGDVVAFLEYRSKLQEELYVGLSGCASDWKRKTYLVDDAGNIFKTKLASGIGYVGCTFINSPVLLVPGGTATFSIVFQRPGKFEKAGSTYSISSAQRVGKIGADRKWRNLSDFNISLIDIPAER